MKQQQQALAIIKQALDMGVKAGIYDNLETTAGIISAYNILFNTIKETDEEKEGASIKKAAPKKLKAVSEEE